MYKAGMRHHPSPSARMRPWIAAALLLLCLALPDPARAQSPAEQITQCLCRNVLARTLCKTPDDFSYVDTYLDGTLTFTVFYADQPRRVLCRLSDNYVHIKGEFAQTMVRSVPYSMDPATGCARCDFVNPDCTSSWTISCCAQKNAQQKEEDKETDFWNRPIPELLKDELTKGMASEPNATGTDGGAGGGAAPTGP